MHIEIHNDQQGAYDLKWRGVALSSFDGHAWSNSFEQIPVRQGFDGNYRLAPLADPRSTSSAARRLIHYQVLMEPLGTNVFFLAEQPRTVTGTFRLVSTDAGGAVYDLDVDPRSSLRSGFAIARGRQRRTSGSPNNAPLGMDEYLEASSAR
jgi:hypothetical protein